MNWIEEEEKHATISGNTVFKNRSATEMRKTRQNPCSYQEMNKETQKT